MPQTTISAGLSVKRPGQEQYSSDGFHLTVEMEAEVKDADHLRAVTQALFALGSVYHQVLVTAPTSLREGGEARHPGRTRRNAYLRGSGSGARARSLQRIRPAGSPRLPVPVHKVNAAGSLSTRTDTRASVRRPGTGAARHA